MRKQHGHGSQTVGALPVPDNQGQLELCVRFALCKAIIDGFMRKKFVPGVVIDLEQGATTQVLNNEHKDTLGKWPEEFDQKEYQFQGADARFWKTKLHIQRVKIHEFEKDNLTTSHYTYVLVYPEDLNNPTILHCVYIDSFNGVSLHCINSHPNNPRPNIPIRGAGNILYRVFCEATEMSLQTQAYHQIPPNPVSTSKTFHSYIQIPPNRLSTSTPTSLPAVPSPGAAANRFNCCCWSWCLVVAIAVAIVGVLFVLYMYDVIAF